MSVYRLAPTAMDSLGLKFHTTRVQVCVRCYINRVRYAWAWGTIWIDNLPVFISHRHEPAV